MRHTDQRRGIVKGEFRRFVVGHAARKYAPPIGKPGTGVCECGCGQPTQRVPASDHRRGLLKGQFRRFVAGHAARVITDATKAKIAATLRGRKPSPEAVAKGAATRTGRPLSPEARAKLLAMLRRTKEARAAAISAAKKGKPFTPQHLAAMRAAGAERRGYRLSTETRARMSAARTGRTLSEETKRKIGDAHRGRKRSDEERAAMSIRARASAPTPEARARQKAGKVLWWASLTGEAREQFVSKRGESLKRFWANLSQEERDRLVALRVPRLRAAVTACRAKWERLTPEERFARMAPMWEASQRANPSSIEEMVAQILDALGVVYQRQVFIGRHLVDFFIKSKRLVIECDGAYWHSLPGRPEQDVRRDAWFQSHNFTVLRLREADIRAGRVADVLAQAAG